MKKKKNLPRNLFKISKYAIVCLFIVFSSIAVDFGLSLISKADTLLNVLGIFILCMYISFVLYVLSIVVLKLISNKNEKD